MTEPKKPTCLWLCCNPDVPSSLEYAECCWCEDYFLKENGWKCRICKDMFCKRCITFHFNNDVQLCNQCIYDTAQYNNVICKAMYGLNVD